MHLPDSEREVIDPAQAEQDAVLYEQQRRRDDLAAIREIHRVAEAYNKAVYAVGGIDVHEDPRAVSERQWRVTLRLAATFIQSSGRMSPAQVRHEWALLMAEQDGTHYLPPDLLIVYEDLPVAKQLEEQAGVQAMRAAMSPHPIIEDHTQLTDVQLLQRVHSADDQTAAVELARRRALQLIRENGS
ncbi:hypothetical protein GS610_08090 [Ruegeria sp. HKCCD6228]|uniref:hypothetical protein n=1 Tax=Ruegeria sp. HKCCD6228 TaxID=2683001 RepID=UPI0014930FBF|nr:hypothetical protein [Ruegeria sp. HKCCD6228]NOD97167.1 hypothetical protein [Ruegeria sp. HKCCD6228]